VQLRVSTVLVAGLIGAALTDSQADSMCIHHHGDGLTEMFSYHRHPVFSATSVDDWGVPVRIRRSLRLPLPQLARIASAPSFAVHPNPRESPKGLRERVISRIADPNTALALVILGALGIYAELSLPGAILPGVAGGILFLLGLSSFRNLPIHWLGVAAMTLGLALLPLAVKCPWRGIVAFSGTAALVVGARVLVGGPGQPRVQWSAALLLGVPFSAVTIQFLTIASRARRNKRETGL
jgi:hypothetical protein